MTIDQLITQDSISTGVGLDKLNAVDLTFNIHPEITINDDENRSSVSLGIQDAFIVELQTILDAIFAKLQSNPLLKHDPLIKQCVDLLLKTPIFDTVFDSNGHVQLQAFHEWVTGMAGDLPIQDCARFEAMILSEWASRHQSRIVNVI